MKNKTVKRIIKIIVPLIFWLLIWEIISLTASDSYALFIPTPFAVIKAFIKMLPTAYFWQATAKTLLRVFAGFITGSLIGFILGVFTSELKPVNIIVSPALKVVRAVPVVSFIILAFLFINIDVLPVYISALMVIPVVWQAVHDGIINTDTKLTEMAKVYKVNRFKTLIGIKLPSCTEQIISSLITSVGLAWKSGIAAEVICIPLVSIGKSIYNAKQNLNFDGVYALTLTVVIFSIVFEVLLKFLWKKYKTKGADKND